MRILIGVLLPAILCGEELAPWNSNVLQWGNEKILATGLETVGTARQSFVIETMP